jgi:DNA-binding beta-propeller fold protein YncE
MRIALIAALILLGAGPAVADEVDLGVETSRVDYQSIDPIARRLYIANMGAGTLWVVDLNQNRLVTVIPDLPKITGVLAVPELHKIYVSVPGAGIGASLGAALGRFGLSSGSGAVAILNSDNLHEITRLPGGVFPDGIAYDPNNRRIFVSDEKGSAITVIDADKDVVVKRIELGGEVGNVRFDPVTGRIYAPLQSRNELAFIEPKSLQVQMQNPLLGCEHPHGLFIAPGNAIGYVACDGNDQLLTVDLVAGKLLDQEILGHEPDVLDGTASRLYVAAESGYLSGFDISNPAHPVPLGKVMIGDNAHSVAVDPATHQLYLPIASKDGRAVLEVLNPPF